jgi:nitrite reductase/ring-hydroxylating ferredoxin subunit
MSEGVRSSLSPDVEPALAALAALPDGVPAACETAVGGAPESLILLRRGDAVRGWLNVCPHAGRRLDWVPGKFLLSKTGQLVCAVHGASFELDAGECVAGPCRGQSLRAVAVRVDADGMVRLAAE